ncbi:MAG TPA: hypothetical protein VEL11_00885 [Candidatus Bathyarchaeia archaeon]|nr:hypothetical protein [Candidatus Bathyarchaeia archaeon]
MSLQRCSGNRLPIAIMNKTNSMISVSCKDYKQIRRLPLLSGPLKYLNYQLKWKEAVEDVVKTNQA